MNSMAPMRPVEILLIEDNPGDVRLTAEALKANKVHINLHVAADGVEAMAFLRRQAKFGQAPRPDLVLLDLNLPKKDGREVLTEMKKNSVLKRIPVVVLTTSGAAEDIITTYDLHANCYVTKPLELDQFIRVLKSIEWFWLRVAQLPPDG